MNKVVIIPAHRSIMTTIEAHFVEANERYTKNDYYDLMIKQYELISVGWAIGALLKALKHAEIPQIEVQETIEKLKTFRSEWQHYYESLEDTIESIQSRT